MRIRQISTCVVAVLLLTAGKPDPTVMTLLRAELAQISEALASLNRKTPEKAPAARDEFTDRCGAKEDRLVKVSNEHELTQALANAKPGDHIRMQDGVYQGRFVIVRSGTTSQRITLCGSRAAILDGGSTQNGYGLHLRASAWHLHGFSVRNARKGIMADGAKHNLLQALEVSHIGDEAIHFRSNSQNNVLRDSWIHDVGLDTPLYGEAVYIGSALSNWREYSGGGPDASDNNQVIGNVLGPEVSAEGVDAKEGTRGGVISGNIFHGRGAVSADSWVDVKGSDYRIENNSGTYDPKRPWRGPVSIFKSPGGWGEGNVVGSQEAVALREDDKGPPYRIPANAKSSITLVLPRRALPYRLPELAVCFPQTMEAVSPGIYYLRESVVAGPGTHLAIRREDVQEIRMRSEKKSIATIVGVRNLITINGSSAGRIWFHSWDPKTQGPDKQSRDGRSFVSMASGRMDIDLAEFTDLGCGTGWASGVAWKGRPDEKCLGNVSRSRFERNYFGAYTFEADSMHWTDNVFAHNDIYGFDPHDNSDYFVVTGNQAFGHPRHGIIFSRGCRGNIVRRNASFSNAGHGIMFDDGKVANDGNPRHFASIPPIGNLVEENEVWGNEVGIALQGSLDAVVRGNRIRDNKFAMRLDGSDRNTISANKMLRSQEFALHLLGGSDSNRIVGNEISGGTAGIVTLDSRHNVIRDNSITSIIGQGIRVEGRAGRTVLLRNRIYGRGSQAINMSEARSPSALDARQNSTNGWMYPREQLPALMLWGTILGVPMLSSVLARMRRSRRRPGARGSTSALALAFFLAGAGTAQADGQSMSLTAYFSAVRDNNLFKYSDTQLRDIETGTTPFRYGIRETGDFIVSPGIGVTWENDMGERRRVIRLRGDGALYRSNAVANFGEVEGTWREYYGGVRRVSFSYGYSPDHLLRKLYDADLTTLAPNDRYRDARYNAHGGLVAWRYEVPFANWLEWTYRFDRRTYERAFRERDSDFHTLQGAVGWDEPQGAASLQIAANHLWRLARAEDGDPGREGDLSSHGPELGIKGKLGLQNLAAGWLYGDAGYSVEKRIHDSRRPDDTANYNRDDLVQSLEFGLGIEAQRTWGARAFYRYGWCRADLAIPVSLDSELGSYNQSQFGLVLEWTSELQRRPMATPGRRTVPDRH